MRIPRLSIWLLPCLLLRAYATSIHANSSSFLYDHQWIPAALVANASRSPCPMLNTLANHGFLPRNGQNITKEDLNKAQMEALNFDYGLASGTTNAMVAKLPPPFNTSTTLTLSSFSSHKHTEHDASLTRLDILQGSNSDIQPALVALLLADSPTPYLTPRTIGLSRVRREFESRAIGSPPLSEAFTSFAHIEASFIPLTFSVRVLFANGSEDVGERGAPKGVLRVWLNEERFPVEEGFERPVGVLTKEIQQGIIEGIRESYEGYLNVSEVLFPGWHGSGG